MKKFLIVIILPVFLLFVLGQIFYNQYTNSQVLTKKDLLPYIEKRFMKEGTDIVVRKEKVIDNKMIMLFNFQNPYFVQEKALGIAEFEKVDGGKFRYKNCY